MLDKRIFYSGIGLAIVLLLFMVLPLWLRNVNVNHPLTAQASIDVCAYLDEKVQDTLSERPVATVRAYPGEKEEGKPICRFDLPPASARDAGVHNVWVRVSTERMMTSEGSPQRTDRVVDT